MITRVIHIHDEEYDVYIGRPKRGAQWKWGNPFQITTVQGRAEVIAMFELWFKTSDDVRAQWMREHIHELKGKTLGCFCAPHACHGDVLARFAEES